jgi:neutral ceramidase
MASPQLLVGAAKVDITPPLHIPHLGSEPRQGVFEGIHDPLHARAAVFDDGDTAVAVLSADALGLSTDLFGPGRDFIAEVRERAAADTGLETEGILLAATHAHSTPETYGIIRIWEREDCAAWLETLAAQLVTTIRLAWRDRRPATLHHSTGRIAGMTTNRRGRLGGPEEHPLDDSLTVLLADRDSAPPVVLTNFAGHPVTVQVQPLVSADYPGPGMATVEDALGDGACCLFLQGAAGDINPIRGHTRDWGDVEIYGMMLAGGVLQAVGTARLTEACGEPAIAARREVVSLPAREAPSVEEARATVEDAEKAVAEVPQDDPEHAERFARLRAAREAYRLAQFGPDPIAAELQALRLGDVAVVGFPGELFCALGLRLREQSPAPVTMIAECANGCLGYLAPRESWEQGGYEVGMGAWCRVAAGGPEQMLETAGRLIDELF